MQAQIETIPEKKLIGIRRRMTLAHNQTAELWRSLMPRRWEIQNKLNDDLISMQMFDEPFDVIKAPLNTFEIRQIQKEPSGTRHREGA